MGCEASLGSRAEDVEICVMVVAVAAVAAAAVAAAAAVEGEETTGA